MPPLRPLALSLSLALAPLAAEANGRFPSAQHFIGGPAGSAERLAVRSTFGLLTSSDRGQTWTFFCEDLLGLSNTSLWDAPIQLTGDGSLLAGLPDGLARLRDGCSSVRVAEVGGDFSADLTASGDGRTVFWIGSSGAAGNRVLASTDGGATFAARGAARDGVLLETIEVSEVDSERVYVTAVQLDPRAFILLRSTDGARSFQELPLASDEISGAYLAGLDPRDRDGVWLRTPLRSDGGVAGTALRYSRDGGARFETVASTRGPMLGFAIAPDGTVFYGGPDDGLWRGRVGDFRRVNDLSPSCLRVHDGALYACANHLRTGWAVGRSRDEGATFDPLLRFESISGPPSCPANTLGGAVCPGRWSVLRRLLAVDAGAPDAGLMHAGVRDQSPPSSCACRAVSPRAVRPWPLVLTLLATIALRRRRRAMLRARCPAPPLR